MNPKHLFVCLSLLAAGCASTSVTRMSQKTYDPKPADCPVEVLSQAPEGRKYEELAMLGATSGQTAFQGKSLNAMLPSMKAKACALGADAIILKNVEAGGVAWITPTQGKASGVAIKYTDGK